jgi:hypothetical protein
VRTFSHADASPGEFVESARQFLATASGDLGTPRNERELPLLALPLVGAGKGGGAAQAGKIVLELLPALYGFTREHPIDVALVMRHPAQYTAAQAERSLRGDAAWPSELDKGLRAKVDELANRAFRQELVLFLGAGVSQSAGLPSWNTLLDNLADKDLAGTGDFKKLDALDKARVIQQRLPEDRSLGRMVAENLRSEHYALAHGLLAALPVKEVVTTNYDQLFESASEAIRQKPDVLPYETVTGDRRWLLKLHGCVSRADEIVLTRQDYLRFDTRHAALAGLVQGLLITRHLLFVGFSLDDDNFHRIADSVRRAVQRQPFGTALSVAGNPLLREVWSKDLDWIEFGGLPGSARQLEVFLDRLAARTSAMHHLFSRAYRPILSPSERNLRDRPRHLAGFVSGVPELERRGAAWEEIERFLSRLGWRRRE